MYFHAFFFSCRNLNFVGRHLVSCPAVEENDFIRTESDGCSCCIDGRVSAANDDNTALNRRVRLQLNLPQKLDTAQYALGLFILNLHWLSDLSSESYKHRFESLTEKVIDRKILAERAVGVNIDSEVGNPMNLFIERLFR